MDDFDMFKFYRLKPYELTELNADELSSQVMYMNDIGRSNVDMAIDQNKVALSYYWNGFADIMESMASILEKTDEDWDHDDFRQMRMKGMLDACNAILRMIEDEEFTRGGE